MNVITLCSFLAYELNLFFANVIDLFNFNHQNFMILHKAISAYCCNFLTHLLYFVHVLIDSSLIRNLFSLLNEILKYLNIIIQFIQFNPPNHRMNLAIKNGPIHFLFCLYFMVIIL